MLKREEKVLVSALEKAGITIGPDGAGWFQSARDGLLFYGPHHDMNVVITGSIDKLCREVRERRIVQNRQNRFAINTQKLRDLREDDTNAP